MNDRRRDRGKRIADLVPTGEGSLGHAALAYLSDLGIRNYSRHYIRAISANLRYFLLWCDDRGLIRPDEITPAVLSGHQRWLYHRRKADGNRLSFCTQRSRLGAVRSFFRWMLHQGIIDWNPADGIELPRVAQRLPKAVLSVAEVGKVMEQPDITTPRGIRDRAILEVLYSTGIRRQEIVDLSIYSIDGAGGVLTVRQGKGKKDRMIPIGKRALAWVETYVGKVRPLYLRDPGEKALFLTTHCRPFSAVRMSLLVRRYVEAAAIGKSGACHLFRHTMATLMLEGGADIRFIQAMLGHVDISTTQIYTRVAIRKLKEVYERSHPGALPEREGGAEAPGFRDRSARPDEEELLSSLAAEAAGEGE